MRWAPRAAAAGALVGASVLGGACGGGGSKAPTTTTAPPSTTTTVPPATLAITPGSGPVGTTFAFALARATPGESVVFEIDYPNGRKFTGPGHTAAPDGSVSASFIVTKGNPNGTYTVYGTGNKGTKAQATFTVGSPTATTAPAPTATTAKPAATSTTAKPATTTTRR
jgi:hypothetical protein